MRRRNLLKNIGATGATLALSGVSVTSAKGLSEHEELGVDVKEIFDSEQVKSILRTLNYPSPGAVSVSEKVNNNPVTLRFDSVETEVTTTDTGSRVTITTIPTNLGDLTAVTINNNLAKVVTFEFDKDLTKREKRRTDVGDEIGWPEDTTALLVGSASGAYFMREVTEREERQLATTIDANVGQASAVETDDWSGYSIQPETDGSSNAHQRGFKVSKSFEVLGRTAPVTGESSGSVVTQGDCDLKIVNCLSLLFPLPTPCIGCAVACSGGQAIPAIGQAACLVCLLATCGSFVLAYGACAGVQDCV